MPEITWRNITTVGDGGNTANRSTANGVDTIMQAFDPLRQELKNYTTRDEQNWDAAAAANTRTMKAELQNIQSLKDLNSRDDQGLINEASFNARFGAQYDPSALPGAVSEARQRLQGVAANEALPIALNAADKERDLTAGLSSLEQQYRSAGMRENEIQKKLNSFMVDNQGRTALYTKANKDEVEAFRSKVASPTSPEQVEALVAQGGKAGVKDLDLLRSTLKGELDDHYIEGKYQMERSRLGIEQGRLALDKGRLSLEQGRYAREGRKLAQEEANNRAMDLASSTALKMLQAGEDPNKAFAAVGGMVRGRDQLPLFNNILSTQIGMSSMRNDQKEQLTQATQNALNKVTERKEWYDSQDASYIAKRNSVTGITPAILKVVDDAASLPGGIIEKITAGMSDTGWEPSDNWTKVKTGKKAAETALNTVYQDLISKVSGISNISPKEVDAIFWLGYQDSAKKSSLGDQGVDPTAMKTAVENRINQYRKGETIEQERLSVKKKADQEIRGITQNVSDFTTASKQAIEKENQTGNPGNISEVLQSIENQTLSFNKTGADGKPVEWGVKKELQDAKKAAADKKAKEEADAAEVLLKEKASSKEKQSRSQVTGNPGADLKNALKDALSQGKNPPQAIVDEPSINLGNYLKKYQQ